MQEIEKKFICAPGIIAQLKFETEIDRYFVLIQPDYEIRVQSKTSDNGIRYELETKYSDGSHASKSKIRISKEEFMRLKSASIGYIHRSSYVQDMHPNVSFKVYHGDFEGLIRAEVEFGSQAEFDEYNPADLFGAEISNTSLGRDSRLVLLTKNEFETALNQNR